MTAAAGNRTIPFEWYADPSVLRLEQEAVFRRIWQYASHTGDLAEPGSFTTARAGDVPVVLTRDREGALRGFVNVCRHRGSVLCEGSGARETLQCPYHAWTYGLDGTLRAAPRADAEPGFDRSQLGLLPVAVDTWGPFLFVNPDPAAAPLVEHLGELPRLLAEGGVDIDALVFHSRAEGEYDANWKVCVENYLECYHCAVAHPSLARAIDVGQSSYVLEEHPTFSSQYGPPKNGGGGVYDALGEVGRGQFHLLFPATVINVMPGHGNLSIGPVVPLGPERTYRFLDYFFAPAADGQWISDFLELDDQVGAEDRALVERVQAGVRSGALADGYLLPESERLIAHFERLLVQALGRG